MFTVNIHNVKSVTMGKKTVYGPEYGNSSSEFATIDINVVTDDGKTHCMSLFTKDRSIIPVVDSSIVSRYGTNHGDWLTDGITAADLELPPMPEESEPPTPVKSDSEKLMDAVRLIEEVRTNGRNDLDRSDRRTLHELAIRVQTVAQCEF